MDRDREGVHGPGPQGWSMFCISPQIPTPPPDLDIRRFEIKLYPIIFSNSEVASFSQVSLTPITEGGVCIFIIINLSL